MNVPIEEPSRRASWMPKRDHGSLLGHVLGFPSLTKIRWGCKPQACCSYNRQHVGHVTVRSYIWDCIAILNLRKNESVTPSWALRQRAMICIWVQSWYACYWADVCPITLKVRVPLPSYRNTSNPKNLNEIHSFSYIRLSFVTTFAPKSRWSFLIMQR